MTKRAVFETNCQNMTLCIYYGEPVTIGWMGSGKFLVLM